MAGNHTKWEKSRFSASRTRLRKGVEEAMNSYKTDIVLAPIVPEILIDGIGNYVHFSESFSITTTPFYITLVWDVVRGKAY